MHLLLIMLLLLLYHFYYFLRSCAYLRMLSLLASTLACACLEGLEVLELRMSLASLNSFKSLSSLNLRSSFYYFYDLYNFYFLLRSCTLALICACFRSLHPRLLALAWKSLQSLKSLNLGSAWKSPWSPSTQEGSPGSPGILEFIDLGVRGKPSVVVTCPTLWPPGGGAYCPKSTFAVKTQWFRYLMPSGWCKT